MARTELTEIEFNKDGGSVSKSWGFEIGNLAPNPRWDAIGDYTKGEELRGGPGCLSDYRGQVFLIATFVFYNHSQAPGSLSYPLGLGYNSL